MNVPVSDCLYLRREEEVIVGVRPEDFLITDEQDAMMTGRIDLIEYLGSETVLTVRAEAGEFMVKAGDRQTFRLNDVLNVKVPPENISLFSTPGTQELIGTLYETIEQSGYLVFPRLKNSLKEVSEHEKDFSLYAGRRPAPRWSGRLRNY